MHTPEKVEEALEYFKELVRLRQIASPGLLQEEYDNLEVLQSYIESTQKAFKPFADLAEGMNAPSPSNWETAGETLPASLFWDAYVAFYGKAPNDKKSEKRCGNCLYWKRCSIWNCTHLGKCTAGIPISVTFRNTDLMQEKDGYNCPSWTLFKEEV